MEEGWNRLDSGSVATRRIGLTGGIASGKSTVATMLAQRGAAVIDADALAREATSQPEVLARIAEELGPGLVSGRVLDRPAVARLVFEDEGARRRLEGIIHPWVRARSRKLEQRLREQVDQPDLIVHDIPLLFEAGRAAEFDAVVVVDAPLEQRVARAASRSGLSREEFLAREQAQWPLERKARLADHLIINDGDLESLERQVERVWSTLLK